MIMIKIVDTESANVDPDSGLDHTENHLFIKRLMTRSARGKNSRGRKVTGIEPMPGIDHLNVFFHVKVRVVGSV